MRCTTVEMWVYGIWTVKFIDIKEPIKRPLLGYRHCPNNAVVDEMCEGYVVYHCETHSTAHARPIHDPKPEVIDGCFP